MKKLLLILLPVLGLYGCGAKEEKQRQQSETYQVFVQGDPKALIADTIQEKTSFLTAENIDEFGDYAVARFQLFQNKAHVIKRESPENIEEGNEATEEDYTGLTKKIFTFRRISEKEVKLESNEIKIAFTFRLNAQGEYDLATFDFLEEVNLPATPEHYSISPDRSKLSLLLSHEDEEGNKVLFSASFYRRKDLAKRTVKVNPKYKYIYGPGVIVPWKVGANRTIDLHVCRSTLSKVPLSRVEKEINRWRLANPVKLDYNIISQRFCRPFSDVNQSSLSYVDDYLTLLNEQGVNPGFAMVNADLYEQELFDADIILLGAEINKNDPSYHTDVIRRTLAHEFGHFLGLHHKFGGTPSIMSYNETTYDLQSYDFEALVNLYWSDRNSGSPSLARSN